MNKLLIWNDKISKKIFLDENGYFHPNVIIWDSCSDVLIMSIDERTKVFSDTSEIIHHFISDCVGGLNDE